MNLLSIEFGSNGRTYPGWLCTDIDSCDIRKPLKWPDASCERLAASHVLEHVSSDRAICFLKECHRILAPGGTLRLIVPCVGSHMTREEITLLVNHTHGHEQGWNEELMRTFLFAAGFDWVNIQRTDRWAMDNHQNVIGEEKDNLESCRLVATKA